MKVLLTGASGFLGGHIAEMLVEGGHAVRALVRRTSRTDLLERLGVELVRGDLTEPATLDRAVNGVEAVIHAAATMSGPPQEFEAATVGGTQALLDAARRAGARRFIHISSIAVLSMERLPGVAAITEDAPYESDPAFLGVYNSSKLAAERAALAGKGKGGMSVVVIRPGLLYGPRGKWALPRMGYALGANRFALIGMGGNRTPVCYVRNCARAAILALEKEGIDGETFDIVDDAPFSQIEYLRRFKKEARPRMRIVRVPYLLARCIGWAAGLAVKPLKRPNPIAKAHLVACVRRLRYSNEKAKRVLGWQPLKSSEAALGETMRWFAAREKVSRRADLKALGKPPAGAPPLKAAIIGCGVIADSHLKILAAMRNARVAALCDPNRDAARALAARYKILHTYTDPAEMLEVERPDVAHILTPPQSHMDLSLLAMRKGANVLVEKPMAMDLAQARQMAECAKETGRKLCVGHNHLFDPVVIKARRLVESGAVGDIIWVESYYGFDLGNNRATRYMLPGGGEHWTFKIPGGLYQNLAPHPISVATDLLGKPLSIRAEADPSRVAPHQPTDELRVFLKTDRGSGMVVVSLAASPRFQFLDIRGTAMRVTVDLLHKWMICESVGKGIPKPIARALTNLKHGWTVLWGTARGMVKVLRKKWTPYDGMELLIREYYAALQEGREPPVRLEQALLSMEIMDETWRQIGPLGDQTQPTQPAPTRAEPHAKSEARPGQSMTTQDPPRSPASRGTPWGRLMDMMENRPKPDAAAPQPGKE